MKTKTIKFVIFGEDKIKEKEVPVTETCIACSNSAIAGIFFPEPYEVKGSENLVLFGDVCFCEEHLRNF